MTYWEYYMWTGPAMDQTGLNDLGAQGWELIDITVVQTTFGSPSQWRYTFKRPLDD